MTCLLPFPPIIEPFGQICSTPLLRQESHGHILWMWVSISVQTVWFGKANLPITLELETTACGGKSSHGLDSHQLHQSIRSRINTPALHVTDILHNYFSVCWSAVWPDSPMPALSYRCPLIRHRYTLLRGTEPFVRLWLCYLRLKHCLSDASKLLVGPLAPPEQSGVELFDPLL
jgi:hypothetical protein